MPEITEIRPVDAARAARMALASLNHDPAAMRLVLSEAQAEEDGLAALVSALAAGYAVTTARLSPEDPGAPLLALISRVTDHPE